MTGKSILPDAVRAPSWMREIIPAGARILSRASTPALVDASETPAPGKCIRVENVFKEYKTELGMKRVLNDISFEVRPGEKMAVLGKNGAGKSTLVRVLGGVEHPTNGTIHRGLFMSWPMAFAGGLEGHMTGIDNIRFIAAIYHQDVEHLIRFVEGFAELGRYLLLPVSTYSSGMRMRLAFALTVAVKFECFLIDEVLSVGDQRFHKKCFDALFVDRKDAAMVLISHDVNIVRQFCSKALVLKNGRGRIFEDLDLAIQIYNTL